MTGRKVPQKGKPPRFSGCAIDPLTHDVVATSDLRLSAYDHTALQGLVRFTPNGSLVP